MRYQLISFYIPGCLAFAPDKVPRCAGFAICGLSVRFTRRRQSSASGSKNHRTALYCRQADSACVLSKRITNLSSKMENCDCRSPAELVPLSRWICNPPSPSYCFMKFSSPGGGAVEAIPGPVVGTNGAKRFYQAHLAAIHRRRTAAHGANEFQSSRPAVKFSCAPLAGCRKLSDSA